MTQTKRPAKSAAVADPTTGRSTWSSHWTASAELLIPTYVGGRGAGRLSSVTSTSTYIQPSELSTAEGIYENSDADDLDDVIDDAKHRFQKQQQHRGSCSSGLAKNVRRWKVNELLSTPPRLIRKIRNAVDATTSDNQHGHRRLAASRSADELTGGMESKVVVEPPPPRRGEGSRFSYIYGSVSDDDLQADGGGDMSSKLETLDRLIPVYEEFKSATARPMSTSSQRISGHYYASIDDLDDDPNKQLYDVERRAPSVVYEVAAPLPDVDSRSTAAQQPNEDDEVDAELPAGDPTDSFPCPVCEELNYSVSLEENDRSSRCAFVDAMHELIVSQAVDARTCGNCTANEGRRTASWRCLDCRNDLCGPCHDAHTSLRLRHRVVSIAALQTGKHQSEISAALAMPCRQHADHNGTSLCLDCGCVVCGQCRRDGEPHAGHRVTEQLGDVASRQRDFIGTLLDDASRRLNELKDNGRVIADYQKPFEAEIEAVVSAINAQVNTPQSTLFTHTSSMYF